MELGENLKEHFSKTTFYGLHAGNNQNSIWKPHSNFAFPEPYFNCFDIFADYKIDFWIGKNDKKSKNLKKYLFL